MLSKWTCPNWCAAEATLTTLLGLQHALPYVSEMLMRHVDICQYLAGQLLLPLSQSLPVAREEGHQGLGQEKVPKMVDACSAQGAQG